jgi:Ca2+-binding RTX toxin-like protein
LESIFGPKLNWTAAFRWLNSFRHADFSDLPTVRRLPGTAMPGLWGGYSRDLRAIFLSRACPQEFLAEALIEEIGHFLDQQLCINETPGDEGTLFARAVLGLDSDLPAEDLPEATVHLETGAVLVEAMSARINQTIAGGVLRGTSGNDTFVLFDPSADIQDYLPSTDWIEASTSINLSSYISNIENLLLTGTQNLRGTGNISNNSIVGNTGNNFLDGVEGDDTLIGGDGNDTLVGISGIDSLVGGSGNDTYYIESTDSSIFEEAGAIGGFDVIYTTNRNIVLGTFENVERVVYISDPSNPENPGNPGPPPGDTLAVFLTGDSGPNSLTGGTSADTLVGLGGNDTLIGLAGNDSIDGGTGIDSMVGGAGNDTYLVDNPSDIVVESLSSGTDFVLASSNFTLPGNVEHLVLSSALPFASSHLTATGNTLANSLRGNSGNNTLDGGAGNDTLLGEGGNDYLIGGLGGDRLDGGSGVATMDGGAGSDIYIVNDRYDRIINEAAGGGTDTVRTRVNFDPLSGTAAFNPFVPDNSPSALKSPSFASSDQNSFYNLENFYLLDQASYGVGNALGNLMGTSSSTGGMLLGMGGDDTLLGNAGNDSLYGDSPRFYAKPDLYAPSPTDTRTQAFLNGTGLTLHGNDYLEGDAGDDHLDGGRGFDTMIGGTGSDTFVQDHVDDLIVATVDNGTNGLDELITSVNIYRAPDGINDIMLVVKDQDRTQDVNRTLLTGQEQVASFASFLDANGGNQGTYGYGIGTVSVSVSEANRLELMYSHNVGDTYRSNRTLGFHRRLNVGVQQTDSNDNTKVAYEISWSAGRFDANAVVGYTVRYRRTDIPDQIWKTYLDSAAQDLRGTQSFPSLTVDNLEAGTYEFEVVSNRLAMPVERDFSDPTSPFFGQALNEQVVTLQGGAGNDFITAQKLVYDLPGGLADDTYTDPLLQNNPLNPLPLGFIFAPEPVNPNVSRQIAFAAYMDGGAGNDLLVSAEANGGLGVDYLFQGITFSGLNTMVGGQGSDTFVVKNGGQAFGDTFDHVIKFGNETPADYGAGGIGASLNGGRHNLIVSAVPYLVLSDTVVSQGKFIDQVALSGAGQFAMGNGLDNFIADGLNGGGGSSNTLVGGVGRDSIQGGAVRDDVLIGGTAYGVDNVGLAIRDFASVLDGGNGLTTSIFRDTDPIPVNPNGPGVADPSQFWFVSGFYGEVFDPNRNRDTLVAADASTLDGGAGNDSLVGSSTPNTRGDNFFVSRGPGGDDAKNINLNDAVFGNGGNDTVTFTDSDYLWWSGHQEGSTLLMNGYTIAGDISNLVLQMGAPTARDATGNNNSTGNDHTGWFDELGSNLVVGNEFDNIPSPAAEGAICLS